MHGSSAPCFGGGGAQQLAVAAGDAGRGGHAPVQVADLARLGHPVHEPLPAEQPHVLRGLGLGSIQARLHLVYDPLPLRLDVLPACAACRIKTKH